MRSLFLLFLFINFAFACEAQKDSSSNNDTLKSQRLLTIINFNRDQTYTTFGSGLGNQVPLIFEAQFSPSYFVSSNKTKWALLMNPQVQLRMLDTRSWPIQVPSYHFYLNYYRSIDLWRKWFANKLVYTDAIWFASLAHHSNGQSGEFYINDSTRTVDLVQGNFSMNYVQLGLMTYTLRNNGRQYFSLREIKIHVEWYPSVWSDPTIKRIYGLKRLFSTLSLGGPWRKEKSAWVNRWLQNSSIEMKAGWIFGGFNNYRALDASHRLIVDINYKYYPPWFDEVSFFLRFYTGQDYYNVYFEKQLTMLTCGISTNTIKFSNSARFVGKKK
jgi:hypothetical protein